MSRQINDLTPSEKKEILELAQQMGYKQQKRKMKTSKKTLWFFLIWALLIQTYVMVMIVELKDTASLAIITGVVFVEVVAAYLGYLRYSYGINMKSMELNYDPNYDENKGVY